MIELVTGALLLSLLLATSGSDAVSAIVTFASGVLVGVLVIFAADSYTRRRHGR